MDEHERAILIGEKTTIAKATGNRLFELGRGKYGALYIAGVKVLTPNGYWLERQDLDGDGNYEIGGIQPDVEIRWSQEDYAKYGQNPNYDPTIFGAIEYLQKLTQT